MGDKYSDAEVLQWLDHSVAVATASIAETPSTCVIRKYCFANMVIPLSRWAREQMEVENDARDVREEQYRRKKK